MGVVWVVDQPKNELPEYALALMGNFPCRLVGSIASVGKLLKLQSHTKPNLLLVNMSTASTSPRFVREVLACDLPATPVVLMFEENSAVDDVLNWTIHTPITEMIRRVKVLLRNSVDYQKAKIFCDSLVLDTENLVLEDKSIGLHENLAPKEARILSIFLEKRGQRIERNVIKARVWGEAVVSDRTVDSHISRLRKRLSAACLSIENIYGGSYVLK